MKMRASTTILAALSIALWTPSEVWTADIFPGINPYWVLLHEPAVVEELKFSPAESKAFQSLVDDVDLLVFPLRNKSKDEVAPGLSKAFDKHQQGLKST